MWIQGFVYSQPWKPYARLSLPSRGPKYSFHKRLSGPQDQDGVKKNLHFSNDQNRTTAFQPVSKRLVAWYLVIIIITIIIIIIIIIITIIIIIIIIIIINIML